MSTRLPRYSPLPIVSSVSCPVLSGSARWRHRISGTNESTADEEQYADELFSDKTSSRRGAAGGLTKKGVKRSAGMLHDFSGGQDMAYAEYNTSRNKELKGKNKGPHNAFFKKVARENAKRKALPK